ncbi:MAG TPA: matrixin family metalloprotease [Bryobacteraceae bacterium]|jgi:predicted Zn-dependent protease|nr:matrixin family metalloprotease [Bryobacteraceae bacterium]
MRTRALAVAALLAALAPFSSGYYYYTLLNNAGGVWTPIPARFDLNPADSYGLPNNTVTYLISSQGPAKLMPGDSFPAVISQIRAAANVWNSVSTSGIRLAFGGLSSMSSSGATPQIDVVFTNDMPPGLIAQTQVTTIQNAAPLIASGATFVPIMNSTIQIRSDLTNPYQEPSWSDAFFLTVAHEFGHALGLQHTKTSSLMTTSLTRAVTKAKPLAADDVAGISLLYPANGFAAATGSITGTVSVGGNGVNLATVVALSTSGAAVSTLTNPDGTYWIAGVPPGQYYVYTQPLPPALSGEAYPDNVKPPADLSGNVYAANTGFAGQFYGGTTDWTQAQQVTVTAANTATGINFNVVATNGPSVYDLVVFSYIGGNPGVPVQAPPLVQGTSAALEFYAWSTTTASGYMQLAPGLNISAIGGAAQVVPNSLAALPNGYPYLYNDVWLGSVTSPTPVALAVTVNGDLYVLPAAFTVTPSGPVTITSVSGSTDGNGNATVTIAGSNLSASSRIVFDGAPATLISSINGSLTVAAPPAVNGYSATVEALNPDGQTSQQTLGSNPPPQFTYGGPSFPAIHINPSGLTSGTDQVLTVTGFSTNFVNGQIAAGFGTSDVIVKQLWVVSPQRMMLNVSTGAAAPAESTTVSIASGLQLESLTAGLQVTPGTGTPMSLRTPILNQATNLAGVPVGGVALINTSGLPGNLAGWMLTIGGQTAQFTYNGSQILAIVPSGLVIGPQVVQLTSPGGSGPPPVAMQVDEAAPVIAAVSSGSGAETNAALSVSRGQIILLTVDGLADPFGILPAPSDITVTIGGISQNPAQVTALNAIAAQLQVAVPTTLAVGNTQVTVQVGTRISQPFTIGIQ